MEELGALTESTITSRGSSIRYSVVVPVYGNEHSIPDLLDVIQNLAAGLEGNTEAVFVVDGSPDASWLVLQRRLRRAPFPSQLIAHSRNFGSFAAIRTGIAVARGRYVAVMAADLQEPPELLREFFRHLETGEFDVAVGKRVGRADTFFSALAARMFWRLFRRVVHKEIPVGGVDIFGCTSDVADELVSLRESHSSLIGLLYWIGFRRIEIPYRRLPRHDGKSGWTLRRRGRYLLDSIFSFTDIPIMILTALGLVGTIFTIVAGLIVLVARVTGQITTAGYTPLMLVLLLSTFTIVFGLGVVGSYVWRTYENSKGRPPSIVMSHQTFEATSESPVKRDAGASDAAG